MKTTKTFAGYEIIDHTADWALRVYGLELADLFQQAALGMTALMVTDLKQVPTNVERLLELSAHDAETLLVDWLSELAFWAEEELLVFSEYTLNEVTETHLRANIRGGQVPELTKHIKAVTYHDLEITRADEGLTATIVFDV